MPPAWRWTKRGRAQTRGCRSLQPAFVAAEASAHVPAAAPSLSAPRGGTKLARVLELLQRDCGATLEELIAATDWLPHTTRAALTGLRKRGCAVTIDRHDKERGSRIAARLPETIEIGGATGQSDAPPAIPPLKSKNTRRGPRTKRPGG